MASVNILKPSKCPIHSGPSVPIPPPHTPVPPEGVDLPIVPQQPHGLGAVPAGECVGAEAAVDQGHVGAEVLVLEVTEIDADLGGGEVRKDGIAEGNVDWGGRRKGRDTGVRVI